MADRIDMDARPPARYFFELCLPLPFAFAKIGCADIHVGKSLLERICQVDERVADITMDDIWDVHCL